MKEDLEKAIETIKNGGVILYPTDTIWGLGCDATNDAAVKRIFKIKNRAAKKQMLILVADASEISKYIKDVPEIAFNFINSAKRPLSIIFQNACNLAPSLIGADNTIGIRVAKDDFCKELIRESGLPLVSTSANVSGNPPPENFLNIDAGLKKMVNYIVEWRQNDMSHSSPSDIIKFGEKGEIIKIR